MQCTTNNGEEHNTKVNYAHTFQYKESYVKNVANQYKQECYVPDTTKQNGVKTIQNLPKQKIAEHTKLL